MYRAVYEPSSVKEEHAAAMAELSHSQLTKFVIDFNGQRRPNILSYRVIAINPVPLPFANDDWVIDFKSPQIARDAMERLQQGEVRALREMFYHFKRIPYCGSLAERTFKAIVHRKFIDGWQQSDGPIPLYISMHSDEKDPPPFSTDPVDGTIESPRRTPLSPNGKTAIEVDLGRSGPPQDVTLDEH